MYHIIFTTAFDLNCGFVLEPKRLLMYYSLMKN